MQINNKEIVQPNAERAPKSQLQGTSEEFLQLFIAQLKNQDPTDPMDSSDMVKNIAQLNQISYLEDMKNSLREIADGQGKLSLGDMGSLIDLSVSYSVVRVPVGTHDGAVMGYKPGMTLDLVNSNGNKLREIEVNDRGEFSTEVSAGEGQVYFQVTKDGEVINQEVTLQGQVRGVNVLSGEVILDNDHAILYDNIKKVISESYE